MEGWTYPPVTSTAGTLDRYQSVESMGSDVVTLRVGRAGNQTTFRIHKGILCQKLEYFSKLFNGPFKEALDGDAEFPEDKAEPFDLILSWIYYDKLRPLTRTEDEILSWDPIDLYSLADKIYLPVVQDLVINLLMDAKRERGIILNHSEIRRIYDELREEAPLSGLKKFAAATVTLIHLESAEVPGWELPAIEQLFCDVDTLFYDFLALSSGINGGAVVHNPGLTTTCCYHKHQQAGIAWCVNAFK